MTRPETPAPPDAEEIMRHLLLVVSSAQLSSAGHAVIPRSVLDQAKGCIARYKAARPKSLVHELLEDLPRRGDQ